MVATRGDPADPEIIHMSKARGVELTSSYEEEKAALLLALDWARANCPTERIATSNRADAVLLDRLRAGHTPILKAYAHLLDPAVDPSCPLCKEEPQTLEHWLQGCPNFDGLRQHTFSSPSPPLGVLTTDTEKVLALARATF